MFNCLHFWLHFWTLDLKKNCAEWWWVTRKEGNGTSVFSEVGSKLPKATPRDMALLMVLEKCMSADVMVSCWFRAASSQIGLVSRIRLLLATYLGNGSLEDPFSAVLRNCWSITISQYQFAVCCCQISPLKCNLFDCFIIWTNALLCIFFVRSSVPNLEFKSALIRAQYFYVRRWCFVEKKRNAKPYLCWSSLI